MATMPAATTTVAAVGAISFLLKPAIMATAVITMAATVIAMATMPMSMMQVTSGESQREATSDQRHAENGCSGQGLGHETISSYQSQDLEAKGMNAA